VTGKAEASPAADWRTDTQFGAWDVDEARQHSIGAGAGSRQLLETPASD
jgi:hypothetical protein